MMGANMEIIRVDEAKQSVLGQEVRMQKLRGRVCIYYPDVICTAPKLQFKICRTCSRAAEYIRNNVVRSIFDYIKTLAISLLKSMNVQSSK
jgi:hypothetical protein